MTLAKPHHYESFPYVKRGEDFAAIELSDPEERRSTVQLGLDEQQIARVDRLFAENLIISFHDHPQLLAHDPGQTFEYLRTHRDYTAYTELKTSGLNAIFDNLVGIIGMSTSAGWKWDDVITALGMRLADLAHQDDAQVALNFEDIVNAKNSGKLAFVLGTESAGFIENELDRIDILYGFGIRQMGLVYSDSNSLGGGQKETRDAGLTTFGRRAVKRMNEIGILIDVSHAGDQTNLDAIEASTKPIAITHAGARALWPTPRMKPDSVLKALAESGGVLGIEAAPHTSISRQHPKHNIESVMDHFTYAVELMGIEHVAFGPDLFYGDHVGLHKPISAQIGLSGMTNPDGLEYERVTHVDGLENPTESFRNVAGWLVKHGYKDTEIGAVLGGNIQRLLKQVWR